MRYYKEEMVPGLKCIMDLREINKDFVPKKLLSGGYTDPLLCIQGSVNLQCRLFYAFTVINSNRCFSAFLSLGGMWKASEST